VWLVYAQDNNGSSSDLCATDKDGSLPPEVARPFLAPRVKVPHTPAGCGIDSCQVRAFVVVVSQAGESQVRGYRFAAMLRGDDVIDLEAVRGVRLRELAVFATVICGLAHKFRKGFVVHPIQEAFLDFFLRAWRALE
jgi:hypothetical protein